MAYAWGAQNFRQKIMPMRMSVLSKTMRVVNILDDLKSKANTAKSDYRFFNQFVTIRRSIARTFSRFFRIHRTAQLQTF
jgi:hypothetical protein